MNEAMRANRYAFCLVGALYLILVLVSMQVPVFWDMYGQVKTASYFLETNFSSLLPNGNAFSDNGHLPLYPLYLAALFKLFGFKLWVAHLSVFPFVLGVLAQLQRLAQRFLSAGATWLVLLLTLAHPAFITQTIYFSSEIALVFFSLWMINSLLEVRTSHISLSSLLLCLFNLRGITLVLVLFAYFLFRKKQKSATWLLTGVLGWITWLIMHYYLAGWFLQNPENIEHRTLADLSLMMKNAVFAGFKLIDLGSFFCWGILAAVVIKTKKLTEPVILLLLSAISVALVCIPLTNPVSNHYFLICYILLLPAVAEALQFFPSTRRNILAVCMCVVLVSNNGVTYPNRYGNAWDCSLKSLAYFDLRGQLDQYVKKNGILPETVSAGFQLYFNDKYYRMNGGDLEYSLLSDTELPTTRYVAESNICNNYHALREKYLQQEYEPVQAFESGAVYIYLYKKR